MKLKTTIYIPYNIKIIVWEKEKNKIVLLLNNNKFFKIILPKEAEINKWSNSITIPSNKLTTNKIKLENIFYEFFNSWNLFFYKKIKFKGKGFRIKFLKKTKLIKFYFGRSHKTFIILNKIKKKKLTKYKFIILGLNKKKIIKTAKKIVSIKKLNFYTLRGLRINRQIIYKRKGKKGTYI